ncbi:MAG: hypothetical protein KC912_08120 [Proteobacteria bacterium]|nr:hypothetical protein [Pseudomonadota bacterium]
MRPTLILLALAACPHNKPPAEAPEAEAEVRPTPPPGTAEYMQEHYKLASAAREAVIAGDLDRTHEVGSWLAGFTNAGLPDEWQPRLKELRYHGETLSQTSDRAEAAKAIAEMARTCGVCHTENGPGPSFNFEPPPLDESSVEGRMGRHQWAAERMWEGLVTPSPTLYQTGARALTGAPMWSAEPLPETVAALEIRVTAIGQKALAAENDTQRVAAYGDLLGLCADCHSIAR